MYWSVDEYIVTRGSQELSSQFLLRIMVQYFLIQCLWWLHNFKCKNFLFLVLKGIWLRHLLSVMCWLGEVTFTISSFLQYPSQRCKWHFGGEEHIIRDLLRPGRTHNCTHSCCPWCWSSKASLLQENKHQKNHYETCMSKLKDPVLYSSMIKENTFPKQS